MSAIVKTGLIIMVLLLGWTALRSQPSAHVMPAPSAQAVP